MNIDFDALSRLIHLVETADICALEVQNGPQIIKIQKHTDDASALQIAQSIPVCATALPQQAIATQSLKEDLVNLNVSQSDQYAIASPMLGTFYRKSGPDSQNFVNVGDRVKVGDTLGIVEAMKIMHEVKADVDGVVLEILVEDGAMVEHDAPLFMIG